MSGDKDNSILAVGIDGDKAFDIWKGEHYLPEDNLKMQELCVSLHQLKISRDNARINAANINIQIKNLNTLIVGTIDDIGRLQRTGLEMLGQDQTDAILNERQKSMQMR